MKSLKIVASVALALTMMGGPAFAANAPAAYHYETANIVVNGKTALAHVTKFVANKTTYMSVYDVQLLVNQLIGTTNKNGDDWQGNVHYWNLIDAKVSPKYISGSYGNTVFKINGQVVMDAPVIVEKPPGDKQPTSFAPIWYVQQVINELVGTNSKTDVWDGAVVPGEWKITTINPGGPMIPATRSGSSKPQWKAGPTTKGQKVPPGTETSSPGTAPTTGFKQ